MNNDILRLIKIVHDMKDIELLIALGGIIGSACDNGDGLNDEYRVCMTTFNSYHDYNNLKHKDYKDPSWHIDNIFK